MFVNGKDYKIPQLKFAQIRKLKDFGIDIFLDGGNQFNPLDFLSGVVALAMGATLDRADMEIQSHVENGHSFDALAEEATKEFTEAIENSPFIKAVNNTKKAQKTPRTAKPSTN